MSAPLEQQQDRVRTGVVSLAGLGAVVVIVVVALIAWALVEPPAATVHPSTSPSPLESTLFEASYEDVRAAGLERLTRYEWVDRARGIVRIPVERAIDAVVADPGLIDMAATPSATQVRR
jgi:hypothetical protein